MVTRDSHYENMSMALASGIIVTSVIVLSAALFVYNLPHRSSPDSDAQGNIQAKAERVQAGLEKLISTGGDTSSVQKLLEELDPLLEAGKYAEAEAVLDQALELLGQNWE